MDFSQIYNVGAVTNYSKNDVQTIKRLFLSYVSKFEWISGYVGTAYYLKGAIISKYLRPKYKDTYYVR